MEEEKIMRKTMLVALAGAMMLSVVGCGQKATVDETTSTVETTTSAADETVESEATDEVATPNDISDDAIVKTDMTTVGHQLANQFVEIAGKDGATTNSIATELAKSMGEELGMEATDVEEGYLPGFTEDIKGFKSATEFGPVVSTIPFVGYVFEVESDDEVQQFIDTIDAVHNTRWNVCTEADEVTVTNSGKFVLYVMAPYTFDEPETIENPDEVVDPEETDIPVEVRNYDIEETDAVVDDTETETSELETTEAVEETTAQ